MKEATRKDSCGSEGTDYFLLKIEFFREEKASR